MTNSSGSPSYRKHTSKIRHLDALRAKQLVKLFARPVSAGEEGVARSPVDAVIRGAHGLLTLDRVAGHDEPAANVVGQYSTHLREQPSSFA